MLLQQLLVAAFLTLGSVTALPEANPDNVEIEARGLDNAEIDARGLEGADIEARDIDGDEGLLVARAEQFRRRCRYGYRRRGHKCCTYRHGRRHCYHRY